MKLSLRSMLRSLGLLAAILVISSPALATLGEGADSVAKDRKAMSAVKRATTTRANYTIEEVANSATTVREYISASGMVFAVAWNGMTPPDLTALLGSYHQEYQNAKRQTPRIHGMRSLTVKGERVVVETWGHMRNLQGRAYLPSLVPAGVNLNDIH